MSDTNIQRVRPGHVTLRQNNVKAQVSEWTHNRYFLPVFSAALVFAVFVMVYVWSNHRAIQTGYTIATLHKERVALVDQSREFKLELENLTALDRLEHVARTQLSLSTPRADQVKVIE